MDDHTQRTHDVGAWLLDAVADRPSEVSGIFAPDVVSYLVSMASRIGYEVALGSESKRGQKLTFTAV